MGNNPRRASTARALGLIYRAGFTARDRVFSCPSTTPAVTEHLEKRQLLSASAAHRTLAKLDSTLTYAYQTYLQSGSTPAGSIQVEVNATPGDSNLLRKALKDMKGTDISGTNRVLDALLPISELGKLASLKSLRFADAPTSIVNTGSVTSQGDIADIAAAARTAYNISGAGVTVGILSDSFNNPVMADNYSTDVASGDLPANVQILSDNVPGTNEGRAMAQVIYDSAPGVTIKFATSQGGPATMAANITALANAGCNIIVDDSTYTTEPFFEDGVIAQAAETAIARGITYISAAGNFASQSYASNWSNGTNYSQGQFTDAPNPGSNVPTTFYAGTSYNFGGTDRDSFTLGAGQSINLTLQWDQPYFSAGGAANADQVDAYVLNAAGKIVGGSNALVVGADPTQHFTFTNNNTSTGNYQLLIVSETGFSAPGRIKFVEFDGQATNWGFLSTGTNASTIIGHANAAGVIAVGSVNYAKTPAFGVSPPVLENNSSTGGTPIYFNTAGGRLATPIMRQEPIVDGPDQVYNTFFGTNNSNGSYTYSGTSAAAAGVAAVAALLKQINPSLTPPQISTAMSSTALAIGTSPNYQAGYGFVQTQPAAASTVGNVSGEIFSDNNFDTLLTTGEPGIKGVTVYLDLNHDGQLDPGDPTTTTAANGTYTLFNQATGTNIVVRAVRPPGYVATTPSPTITIVGRNTSSNVNLGFFPIIYTATTATTYTLQLSASNASNANILINGTLTYNVPIAAIPSFGFNVSGGNSSLIVNFANGNPIPAGGVTYNGLSNSTANSLIINLTSASDNVDYNDGVFTLPDGSTIGAAGIQNEIVNGNGGNDNFNISGAQPATVTNLAFNCSSGNNTLSIYDILPNNGVGTTFNAGTGVTQQNTLNVHEGTFTFSGNPAATSSNLTINVAGTATVDGDGNPFYVPASVVFAAGALHSGINQRNIAALSIGNGGSVMAAAPASHSDREVLITNSLSILPDTTLPGTSPPNTSLFPGGILDLNANDLIVNSTSLGVISPLVGTGFNNGQWNGSGGIDSSAAAADTTHLTALGSIQNNQGGTPLYGTGAPLGLFDGVSPAASAVLIKYTYYGDANLDGKVDGSDYSRVDTAYLKNQSGPPLPLTGWFNGDFNYDGTTNGSDYTLLDNAFNSQGSRL